MRASKIIPGCEVDQIGSAPASEHATELEIVKL